MFSAAPSRFVTMWAGQTHQVQADLISGPHGTPGRRLKKILSHVYEFWGGLRCRILQGTHVKGHFRISVWDGPEIKPHLGGHGANT